MNIKFKTAPLLLLFLLSLLALSIHVHAQSGGNQFPSLSANNVFTGTNTIPLCVYPVHLLPHNLAPRTVCVVTDGNPGCLSGGGTNYALCQWTGSTWKTVGGGGGDGTVSVVGAGSLTSTAIVTGGGGNTIQTPAATATLDGSGNISTPGTITSGGTVLTIGGSISANQLVGGTGTNTIGQVPGWTWGGDTGKDLDCYGDPNCRIEISDGSGNQTRLENGILINENSNTQNVITVDATGTYPVIAFNYNGEAYSCIIQNVGTHTNVCTNSTFVDPSGNFTATSYTGSGAGLTGTAPSLTAGTASAVSWSGLTSPTGPTDIGMLGYTATLAWYTTGTANVDMSWVDTAKPGGGTNPAFAFTDANGNDRTGALVFIKTGIGSQALPISITAGGNGVQMDTTGALSAIGSGQIIATNLAKYLQNCGTLTTTASTTDALSCAWVTTSSNCTATQNSTGTIVAFTAVVPTAGTVTVTHTATSGGTYAIACSVD